MIARGTATAWLSTIVAVVAMGFAGLRLTIDGSPRRVTETSEFLERFTPLGKNSRGYREYEHRRTGIVFVELPGGAYHRGADGAAREVPAAEGSPRPIDNERPRALVEVSPFLIAKHEVTRAQWKALHDAPIDDTLGTSPGLPATGMTWVAARQFVDRAGLELPSETEWEYACGDAPSDPARLAELAWFRSGEEGAARPVPATAGDGEGEAVSARYLVQPVGLKQANEYGLHDMLGNAWEWCQDVYDPLYYWRVESRAPDPVSSQGSSQRVVRGGSAFHTAEYLRPSFRRGADADRPHRFTGLRPVYRLRR